MPGRSLPQPPGFPAFTGVVVRAIRTRLAFVAVLVLLAAAPAAAQPYARYAVPDSALAGVIRGRGPAAFEIEWNTLLVTELRASLARADSAARLLSLERRVAAAEPSALGTRIGQDALALRERWGAAQRRMRIAAGTDESLGFLVRRAGSYQNADSLYRSALGSYRKLEERRRTTLVLATLGGIAMERRDYAAVDSITKEALAGARAADDPRQIGVALNMLGSAAFQTNRLSEAWEYYQGARAARERAGDRSGLARTLGYLGNVANAQGRSDTAEVYYRSAIDLSVALRDTARIQENLGNYAVLVARGRDPAASFPLYDRSLEIYRQRGDLPGQTDVLINIGNLLRQQGHYAEALGRLGEARGLAIAAGDARRLHLAELNSGRVALALGDPEGARPRLERAAAIADSLGDLNAHAAALNNLSIAATFAGDVRGAERLARQALADAEHAGDSTLVHDVATTLGEIAFDAGRLEEAHAWFERSAAAGAREEDQRSGDIQNLASVAVRAGRLDEAERLYREALAVAESSRSPDAAWPPLLGLGDVAERRGHYVEALAFDRRAASMIESMRARQASEQPSVHLLARRLFAFEALIHLLTRLQSAYPDSAFAAEAFHWSERSRARSFLDLVAASGGEAGEATVRPLTLDEAQGRIISDREALLSYSVGDSSTSLWVIRRNAWKHFRLPARAALRIPVELLRRGLADPASAETRTTLGACRTLYRSLIQPARTMLDGVDHLIIAPDGALATIPFEALLATDLDAAGHPPARAYLVERYAVSYTASATVLATRTGTGAGKGIVAVGNPVFGSASSASGPTLAPLPGTAAEIEALEQLAGARPITVLTGKDATRERLLGLEDLSRAVLVHIATHGEANAVEPERSGLWMATPANGSRPGFVSLSDILGLRLGAGLVTLSACQTGLGRMERGEGVMGLSRAFLAAGARSILVSLWKVNDASTAALMRRFYRGLLEEGASGADALAGAKRSMIRNAATRAPFYWAPFILVGDAGRLGG